MEELHFFVSSDDGDQGLRAYPDSMASFPQLEPSQVTAANVAALLGATTSITAALPASASVDAPSHDPSTTQNPEEGTPVEVLLGGLSPTIPAATPSTTTPMLPWYLLAMALLILVLVVLVVIAQLEHTLALLRHIQRPSISVFSDQ